jgi:Flp pilus assembly CpaE family ATPase
VLQLIELSRHLATWLVLDVPANYDDLFFRSLAIADRVVLVADQSVAAIRGAQMVCDSLGKQKPIAVINRYNSKISGLSVESIQKFLPGREICTLANDPAVGASMNSGQLLHLYSHNSPVLTDVHALIKKLDPDAALNGNGPSILRRLGRALSLT